MESGGYLRSRWWPAAWFLVCLGVPLAYHVPILRLFSFCTGGRGAQEEARHQDGNIHYRLQRFVEACWSCEYALLHVLVGRACVFLVRQAAAYLRYAREQRESWFLLPVDSVGNSCDKMVAALQDPAVNQFSFEWPARGAGWANEQWRHDHYHLTEEVGAPPFSHSCSFHSLDVLRGCWRGYQP